MSSGSCGLCREPKTLQKSHLLPAGVYKALLQDDDGAPAVVNNLNATAVNTNFQPRKEFLCSECEQRFSAHGEDHVLRNCFRGSAGFALREALQKITPVRISKDQAAFVTSQLPAEIRTDAYRYFALSVLWRASVTEWPGGYGSNYRRRLGTKYEEAFRQYLLGNAGLPGNIGVNVLVDFESPPDALSYPPTYARINDNGLTVHRHTFMIPGVRFMVLIGDYVSRIQHPGEGEANSAIRFIAWEKAGTEFRSGLVADAQRAKPKGKLARKRHEA
jgi:hypothetical protein